MNIHFVLMILFIFSSNIIACQCDKGNINMLCNNNVLEYAIPYGIGSTDGIVLQFTNLVDKNCTIIFHSREGLQIVVLESNVEQKHSTNNISILTEEQYFENVCSSDCLYVKVLKTVRNKILLRLNKSKYLKITVTAAKVTKNVTSCNESHEVQCKIDGSKICISKELQCDYNINCGTYNLNDEDSRICRTDISDLEKIPVIIAGFICTIIIIIIIINIIKKISPRMPEVFFIAYDKRENTLVTLSNSHEDEDKSQSLQSIQNGNMRSEPPRHHIDHNLTVSLMPKRKQRTKRTKMKRLRNNSPVLESSHSGYEEQKPEPTEILNITLSHKEASPKHRHMEGFTTERQMKWSAEDLEN